MSKLRLRRNSSLRRSQLRLLSQRDLIKLRILGFFSQTFMYFCRGQIKFTHYGVMNSYGVMNGYLKGE